MSVIPVQDLWGIFLTQTWSEPLPSRPLLLPLQSTVVDPSSFGGTVRLWQRLRVHFNESHHIRIYYVSSWFRSVSEFINMLNG